ncbi:MAG: transposase, partial [Pseudanabaena sp.]
MSVYSFENKKSVPLRVLSFHCGVGQMLPGLFTNTQVQLCIVHMVRNSVAFVPWQQRKQVCADL